MVAATDVARQKLLSSPQQVTERKSLFTAANLAKAFRGLPVENELGAGIAWNSPQITFAGNISTDGADAEFAPVITSGGNLATTASDRESVDYVPGNEEACRQTLDRVVSDDANTFRMGGLLVILRIPSQTDLPVNTAWSADFPGTTPATTADIMERAERLIWRQPGGGRGSPRLVRTHPPRGFVGDYLVQMRDRYGARPLAGIARTPVITTFWGSAVCRRL